MSLRARARTSKLALATAGALSLATAAVAAPGVAVTAAPPSAGSRPLLDQFIGTTPHLNSRSVAAATMVEKLHGGGESVNGPAQEQYENRAYPATSVGTAQVTASRTNFGKKSRSTSGFTQVGPDGQDVPGLVTYTGQKSTVGGRTTAVLPLPGCTSTSCTVLIGTAGGGVWRSTNAAATAPTWAPVGSGITSNAIGSLTQAGSLIYAGTGEANGSSDSEAGTGLFVSRDNGSTFAQVPTKLADGTDLALGRSVATVAVDRTNAKHLFVGTAVARHGSSSVNGGRFTPPAAAPVGLYESRDGGASWTLAHAEEGDTVAPGSANGGDFFRGGVTRVEQDPNLAGVWYAAFMDYGLYRGTSSGWNVLKASGGAGDPNLSTDARTEFDAVAKNGKTRIYLGDATALSSPNDPTLRVAALFRTDDATAAAPSWSQLSDSNPTRPGGYASYNYCNEQCSYDMPVASPDGQPDVVYIGGQMQYDEIFTSVQPSNGRAVQRSQDAGVSFTDMTNDSTGNGLHPDQHAIAFGGPFTFLGSDGGVNRLSGPYVSQSAKCDKRGLTGVQLADCRAWLAQTPTSNAAINGGLETLQFQSASVSPSGSTLLAGAQDNGTWTMNSSGGDAYESVGGDGGQSGFDAVTETTRYHSYYGSTHDVNFNGSDPAGWEYMSQPLDESGEAASFYTPLTADPKVGGTVFDGLEHVWRTQDSGGDKAYLHQHCNELTGDFAKGTRCGDWQPLGRSLVSDSAGYGTDKAGSYVVAIARAAQDTSTMWVGTRRGRLFLSRNVDTANAADVAFTRLDGSSTPTRFISGIVVDPADANHAFVTYSGYDSYARQAKTVTGHVFEVRVNGSGAAFTDISGDLGDQPITGVGRNPATGALYAATDYGVLTATPAGASTHWTAVPGLPIVAVYGLTLDPVGKKLYAVTHGRGIWGLAL